MKAKDTLWHINWGDGDNFYILALDEEAAIKAMPDGQGMVNYAIRLDSVAAEIFKAGIKEAVEWIKQYHGLDFEEAKAKLKEWGIEEKQQ